MDMRHGERLIAAHQFGISVGIGLFLHLDTTVPVILCDFRITFHNVSIGIHTSVHLVVQLASSGFRFQDTMSHIGILGCGRSRLVIVVNHVEHCRVVSSVRRAMHPVENHIVHKVKDPVPSDRRVTSRVAGPQVTGKSTVLPAQRASERMVVRIQRFGRDGILYGYINSRQFSVFRLILSFTFVVHVAVERDILI